MPNHTARTERSEAGIRSIACAVERSVAIVTPASTPASTVVATTSPSIATNAPLSRREDASTRARRRAERISRRRPPALPVRRRLRPVPADRHRAPGGRRVPRCVVEQPAAMRTRARLESPPGARRLRLEHARQDLGERAVYAVVVRASPSSASLAELEAQRASAATDANSARSGSSPGAPPCVPFRELSEHVAQCTRAHERARIDDRVAERSSPRPEPLRQQLGSRDVVDRPDGDLGVHEVLDEVERRRRRCAACRLEARRNVNHPMSIDGVYDTVKTSIRRFQRLTPCTGLPAASHA